MATGEVSGLSAHSQSTLNSITETLPAVLFRDQHRHFISGLLLISSHLTAWFCGVLTTNNQFLRTFRPQKERDSKNCKNQFQGVFCQAEFKKLQLTVNSA